MNINSVLVASNLPNIFYSLKGDIEEIMKFCIEKDILFYHIDGRKVNSDIEFFELAKILFAFPERTGDSWDAFFDRMRNAPWDQGAYMDDPKNGMVVVYSDFQQLALLDPDAIRRACGNFWAISEWKKEKYNYHVFFILIGDISTLSAGAQEDIIAFGL